MPNVTCGRCLTSSPGDAERCSNAACRVLLSKHKIVPRRATIGRLLPAQKIAPRGVKKKTSVVKKETLPNTSPEQATSYEPLARSKPRRSPAMQLGDFQTLETAQKAEGRQIEKDSAWTREELLARVKERTWRLIKKESLEEEKREALPHNASFHRPNESDDDSA